MQSYGFLKLQTLVYPPANMNLTPRFRIRRAPEEPHHPLKQENTRFSQDVCKNVSWVRYRQTAVNGECLHDGAFSITAAAVVKIT